MVTDGLIAFGAGILRTVLLLLPTWTPPGGDGGFGQTAGGAVGMLSGYFPVVALAACIAVVYGLKLLLVGWTASLFVYDRLPFKAT